MRPGDSREEGLELLRLLQTVDDLPMSGTTIDRATLQRLLRLAHFDALTGLANRPTFYAHLDQLLGARVPLGVLYIDLDGFKRINDSRGHRVGDELLRQVAARLRIRFEQPGMMLGRLGGDEFALVAEQANPEELPALADALVCELAAPYHIDHDRCVRIGASVGIAHSPEHGVDAEQLLARADIALYAAKAAGRGMHRVFLPGMEQKLQERLRLEERLRAALDGEPGLEVYYQPIIDLRTRRVTAREALVRWTDAEDGALSPADFVPVAEQGGLIEPLGAWVLRQACRDAAGWEDGTRVAVNVSPGQLGRGTLLPMVRQALHDSLLAPGRLEIEVTESALLNHVDEGIAELRRVRDLGVRVALDDFGTGFSSLAHLRAFPFDKIKIDGSFVRDAVLRPDCAAVVRAIADLGRRLGVTTVAEGVETLAHLERVIIEGCTEAQGFLFGEPLPNASMTQPGGAVRSAWVA